MKRRVLVSWIGHTDLHAMATNATAKQRRELEKVVGATRQVEGKGPVQGLVQLSQF